MGKLLEKARNIPNNSYPTSWTNDDIELVEAWLDDDITMTQIAKAKNLKGIMQAYTYVARVLKYSYQKDNK